MSQHRQDTDIRELQLYFDAVINWAKTIFGTPRAEMKGLEWGELYERFHAQPYNPAMVQKRVEELYADEYVSCKKGIFEYVLGGEHEPNLLQIRFFEKSVIKTVYEQQTAEAKKNGLSNCPLCALQNGANRTRIYKLSEMDADHITAWSKGGATTIENCQMLCVFHNRSKKDW